MSGIASYAHTGLRIVTGYALVHLAFLDLQKVGNASNSLIDYSNGTNIFCLCTGQIPALHAAHFALVLSLGLFIFLGVRTRLVAAFTFVLVLAHCLGCVDQTSFTTAFQQNLMGLTLPLTLLVIIGGGRDALYRRGWADLPF